MMIDVGVVFCSLLWMHFRTCCNMILEVIGCLSSRVSSVFVEDGSMSETEC